MRVLDFCWCFVAVGCVYTADEDGYATINLSTTGGGRVTASSVAPWDQFDCGRYCGASFARGRTVTFTATPDEGQTFLGWYGVCEGTAPTCEVEPDDDLWLAAEFGPVRFDWLTSLGPNRADTTLLRRGGRTYVAGGIAQDLMIASVNDDGAILSSLQKEKQVGGGITGLYAMVDGAVADTMLLVGTYSGTWQLGSLVAPMGDGASFMLTVTRDADGTLTPTALSTIAGTAGVLVTSVNASADAERVAGVYYAGTLSVDGAPLLEDAPGVFVAQRHDGAWRALTVGPTGNSEVTSLVEDDLGRPWLLAEVGAAVATPTGSVGPGLVALVLGDDADDAGRLAVVAGMDIASDGQGTLQRGPSGTIVMAASTGGAFADTFGSAPGVGAGGRRSLITAFDANLAPRWSQHVTATAGVWLDQVTMLGDRLYVAGAFDGAVVTPPAGSLVGAGTLLLGLDLPSDAAPALRWARRVAGTELSADASSLVMLGGGPYGVGPVPPAETRGNALVRVID